MSRIILRDSLPSLRTEYIKVFTVEKKRESLADYVRRVREEKKLSLSDVERQSGSLITNGYVSRIENGYILNVTPKKLTALAKGLGVSEDEVFAVARGKSESGNLQLNELRLLEYFRALSEESQEDVLTYLEMLSGRRSAMERARGAKPPISSIFSQTTRRSTKKRVG